jgi:biopolymer transport protein ExbD
MRHKKKKHSEDNELMSLQITSMADIFTIILVFLLKSYATSSINASPSATLPHVHKSDQAAVSDALMIEVVPHAVLIDQKAILKLRNFVAPLNPMQALSEANETQISTVLLDYLKKERKKIDATLVEKKSKVTIMADENTPYSVLQEVIRSCSATGFSKLQLLMVKDE